MLQKRKWLLLTFYTTAGVMALERACTQAGLPGRIVPVPRSITADCGMAWRAQPEDQPALEALTGQEGLETEGFYQLLL